MRLRGAIAISIVAAVSAGLGQGQQAPEAFDPEAVLKRTRERLLADLERLPRYTCVQTITRRYYRAPEGGRRSCARLIEEHEKRKKELPLDGWDRLRLEVAIAEGQNVYSWLGASKFEAGNIEELAGSGPLGSGDFGSFLEAVLRRATISFQQEKVVGGRRLLQYSYDIAVGKSGYLIKTSAGWVPTAHSGSFLLDPAAADIASLTVRTAELPESNPACQAISEVEYGRTAIHDRMILIPQETRLNVIDRPGSESVNVTEYSSCREYASKSRILMSAPSEGATVANPQSAATASVALSPNLSFQCRIVTPIDSDTAAAGDPIEGVLLSPIHDKNNNLRIPTGAPLRGRLSLVQHRAGAFDSIRIAVQWKSIEVKGREVPLRATPEVSKASRQALVVPDFDSLGQRLFVFRKKHLLLREWEWAWTTQAPDSNVLHLSSTTMRPFTVEVAETEFPIQAESDIHFKFTVPSGASGVLLEGTFTATGGGSNDVALSLFSSDQFAKLEDQEAATALYESGRTHQAELHVELPPDAGTYYLVFSNDFPLSTPKVVQTSLRLHYKL